jgi:transaldolase
MTETIVAPPMSMPAQGKDGASDHPFDPARLRVKIFADGADRAGMLEMYKKPYIAGFTTNPTLMRKANVSDYRAFALDILDVVMDRPVSFEVLSDDFADMERQAHKIASWGDNVYVKIPVTNTRRESSAALVHRLSHSGVKVNVTALLTVAQVRLMVDQVAGGAPSYISIFAGRVADTGRDPVPVISASLELLKLAPNSELIWASPREVFNVIQADALGCHVITVTNEILKKLSVIGRDLDDYSLETVSMFHTDARLAGFDL